MLTHDLEISEALSSRLLRATTVYELLPPGRDAEDRLTNGGFETWGSPTDATGWVEVTTGGSIDQEATIVRGGDYSARFDKTSASPLSVYQLIPAMKSGKWYKLEFWIYTSGPPGSRNMKVLLYNQTTSESWDETTETYTATETNIQHPVASFTASRWTRLVYWFQWDPNADSTDALVIRFLDNNGTGAGFWYLDDVSIEGPYDRKGLYYASRNISWNGISYTPRVLKVGDARDTMKMVQSRLEMTLGNADVPLRTYLDPLDTFTGGALIARTLFLDSSFVPDPDRSLIYWQGIMQRPKRGSDEKITIEAVGRLNPYKVPCPSRRLTTWCQVREFADGVDCNYTSTTNANGAGSDSTALTTNAALPATADGQYITIGNGEKVLVSSGGGTTSIVLAEARTWANSDAVAFAECDRQWSRCLDRARTHEFQGFRATREVYPDLVAQAFIDALDQPTSGAVPPELLPGVARDNLVEAAPNMVVPIVYGRVWTEGRLVESLVSVEGQSANDQSVRLIVLGEGEIEGIVNARVGDDPFEHIVDTGVLTHGYYWRPGAIGALGDEIVADYAADPVTQKRDQNTDYRTATGSTMSRSAYVMVLIDEDGEETDSNAAVRFDVKGRKLQQYLADGTPDGSPVYSANPIWAAVDVATTRRFALSLASDEIDMEEATVAADFCDEQLTSTLAIAETTATTLTAIATELISKTLVVSGPTPATIDGTDITIGAGGKVRVLSGGGSNTLELEEFRSWTIGDDVATALVEVTQTEGFYRGQTIDVGADTGVEVERNLNSNNLVLTEPIVYSTGESIQGYVERFDVAYLENKSNSDAIQVLKQLLVACRGYVTHDHAAGKVQFKIERAHVTDVLSNGSLDDWTGSAPDSWTEIEAGASTIDEETTIVHTSGGSSAKLAKRDANTVHLLQVRTGFQPGRWYLLSFWVYSDTEGRAIGVKVHQTTDDVVWLAQPGEYTGVPEWVAESGGERSWRENIVSTGTWLKMTCPFYWLPTWTTTDSLSVRIFNDLPTSPNLNGNVYVDDVKLEGPLAGYYRDSDEFEPLSQERVTGGDLDNWSSGVPVGWLKSETNGTVSEETTIVRTVGGSSAKIVRTAGSGNLWVRQANIYLLPGRAYRLGFWQYSASGASTIADDQTPWIQFLWYDGGYGGTATALREDGSWLAPAWSLAPVPGGLPRPGSNYDKWIYYELKFVTPTNARADDPYDLRFQCTASAALQTVYIDDVSIVGPVDKTPIVQPGMGIVEGAFQWANDEHARREINQVAVKFSSQDLDGKTDEAVENDFDDQVRRGYAKRKSISSASVGHLDLASRLSKHHVQKLQGLGPGAVVTVAWYGALAQPGDIIAVRHSSADWYGDLLRISAREVKGLGSRSEFTSKLTLEDYDATIYPDQAREPTFGIAFQHSTVTLAADTSIVAGSVVGSTRGIRFTWSWAGPQIGITRYVLHKSVTSGFRPSSSTVLARDVRGSYTYVASASELGVELYFKLVATGRGTYYSNQLGITPSLVTDADVDPNATDNTAPFNLVYDGDFNFDYEWNTNNSATQTAISPTTDADGLESNQFADRNFARDNLTGTDSDGTATTSWVSGTLFLDLCSSTWSFEGRPSSTETGRLETTLRMTPDAVTPGGFARVYISTNGGSSYLQNGVYSVGSIGPNWSTLFRSYPEGVDPSLIRVRVTAEAVINFNEVDTSQLCEVRDVIWREDVTATIVASISGGSGALKSDGLTAAKIWRVFPGSDPAAQIILSSGDTFVVRLRAKQLGSALDASVFVKIIDGGETSYTLMEIPAADITTTDTEFAALFTAPSDLDGVFVIQVDTLSTEPVEVDRLSVQEGTQITRAVTSVEEQIVGTYPDKQAGTTGSFEPGPWTGTIKKATIT